MPGMWYDFLDGQQLEKLIYQRTMLTKVSISTLTKIMAVILDILNFSKN
jgi:hypothetical protein